MQLGVPQLKGLLRQAAGAERRRLLLALLARDAACVGFAVVFISALTALFGGANSPAAVVIFCLLLSCRFVHYNYRMADTLRNMAAAFALLTLGPALAPLGGPLLHLLLNLFCIGVLLLITADQPELGNASLYLFSYLFLYGNPVSGRSLALRGLEMLLGFALCAAVLYHNHRGRTPERPFRAVLRAFSLADEKCRWQLRVAVGISLAVLTGELLGLPRIMWVGFSCSSILTAYGSHPVRRAAGRVGGVLGGSLLFCLLYQLCPPALHGGLGILSGLCLGLCASYGFCTVFNCLGALLTASALFGPGPAAAIRVCNNVLGSLFGLFFALVWPWLPGRAVPPPDGGGPGELARQECHVVPDAPILRSQGQGLPGGLQGLGPPPGVVQPQREQIPGQAPPRLCLADIGLRAVGNCQGLTAQIHHPVPLRLLIEQARQL